MVESSRTRVRNALLVVIGVLLLSIVGILVVRSNRARQVPEPLRPTATGAVTARGEPDNALERARRAVAVSAIESGDYQRAVEELTGILKTGRGVGDEVELLRIAKELQEKAVKPSAPPSDEGGAPAVEKPEKPDRPVVAAAPVRPTPPPAKAPPTPAKKNPVVVAKASPPPPPVAAAPVAPARDNDGQLLVFSVPVGLTVEVDGNEIGVTPVRRPVAPGRHFVVVTRNGTHLTDRTVSVTSDEVTTVDFDVREKLLPKDAPAKPEPTASVEKPPPAKPESVTPPPVSVAAPAPASRTVEEYSGATGEVFVDSGSLGGVVFINGTSYGPAPLLARSVRVGTAVVELRANGETRRSKEVTVREGQRADVRFR